MPAGQMNIVVGIATSGRRDVLTQMLDVLAQQTRLPNRVVICPTTLDDVDQKVLERFPVVTEVIVGKRGLPAQRNEIIARVQDADAIVFFDDDFLVAPSYIERLEQVFLSDARIVAVTGHLFADGANGPGLSVEQGRDILQSGAGAPIKGPQLVDCYGTYGCNMAFRLAPVVSNKLVFDENLPLYGWQEDIDFSRSLAPYGRIVWAKTLRGVHLGIKVGRTSGIRFGYSQIANPVYLIRKGTMSWRHAGKLMWRNLASNMVRSLRPEPWIDRKGRMKGNWIAVFDMVVGRLSPRRILQLD